MRTGRLLLAAVLLTTGTAEAHDLSFDCTRKGQRLEVFAYFDDGTPAQKARVRLLTADDEEKEQAAGWTDGKGRWETATPGPGTYVMIVDGGAGHRARQTLRIPSETGKAPTRTPKTERVGEGPTREEFTSFPWVKMILGLGIIGLVALAFLAARRGGEGKPTERE